jgi:dTDP-glucose 4,6-dehydratase
MAISKKKNSILITGGSGFIGTNIVDYLLKKNYEIINIDKISYSSVPKRFLNLKQKKYFFYKTNINNKHFLKKIFKKHKNINCIVNLASNTHVDRSIDDPVDFIKQNINDQLSFFGSLLTLKKKIKLIHFSTDEVFGDSLKKKSFHEGSKYEPNSPYSASKSSVDQILHCFKRTFDFDSIILHPCNNFGPFQFTEKFIPLIISNLLKKKKIPIYGSGKQSREWLHVSNTCLVVEKIIKSSIKNGKFVLGSSYRCTNLELAKKICNEFDKLNNTADSKKSIKHTFDRPGHDIEYRLNSSKIKKTFKILLDLKFDESLKNTMKFYLNNQKWIAHCNKKYSGRRLGKSN